MPRWNVNFDMRLDQYSPELVALAQVIHAIAELVKALPLPPDVDRRLNALNIARAVAGTTGIEGSTLTVDEVEKSLAARASGSFRLPGTGKSPRPGMPRR